MFLIEMNFFYLDLWSVASLVENHSDHICSLLSSAWKLYTAKFELFWRFLELCSTIGSSFTTWLMLDFGPILCPQMF